jgi:hypothetical protein
MRNDLADDQSSDSGPFVFTGTLMDGPDIDLIEISGLTLSDDELDALWGETTPRGLLMECPSCGERLIDEIDDAPGLSDSYFEYECADRETLADELRAAIFAALGRDMDSGNKA